MSQEALARRMDVSRQAVTKWESGQSAPSTENLFRLAELFDTTVDLLLPSGGGRSGGRGSSTPVVLEPLASPGPGGSGGNCAGI